MSMHVAIIGAGPSGLVTAKELLAEGHRVTVFEREAGLGGVFHYCEDARRPGVWRTCKLTSSILVTYFSDFFPDWETDEPYQHRHLTHQEYIAYLEAYADHFEVMPKIRFEHSVDRVRRDGESWQVTTTGPGGEETALFDAVAVCSGVHSEPYIPDLPGLELVRTIAAARITMPRSVVRLSAGRNGMSDELHALCFLAGANSIFLGDRLLTTANPGESADDRLLDELGVALAAEPLPRS